MGIAIDNCFMNPKEAAYKKEIKNAVCVSNMANIVLCSFMGYASAKSGSIAITASTVDCLLNLLSGFILWSTAIKLQRRGPWADPLEREKLQPMGVVIFASLAAASGLQMLTGSSHARILEQGFSLEGSKKMLVVSIMLLVMFIKSFLVSYCRSFRSELLKIYAQDHVYDIIINAIGLVAALLASKLFGGLDLAGAILLGIYTARMWCIKVLENVNSLAEKTAPPDYLRRVAFLSSNGHRDARHIDTISRFVQARISSGDHLIRRRLY